MSETEESKQDRIAQRVRDWDANAIAEVIEYRGESTLVVPKSHLRRVCEFLRDYPALRFSFLSDVQRSGPLSCRAAFRAELSPAVHFQSGDAAFAPTGARGRSGSPLRDTDLAHGQLA